MKPATNAWLRKAEGDHDTALRELRARRRPNYDAACFHAQQAIEKHLKALLTERGKLFPKIHDLVKLGEWCGAFVPHLIFYEEELDRLARYAVVFRYPGETATRAEAATAIAAMRRVRTFLKDHAGLKR